MILLVAINAKYIHSNLAVYSLMVNAGSHRDQVDYAEYTINHSQEEILIDIYERQPEVVAFSCYIWNIQYVNALIANIKKVMPKVKIALGGPEVSYDAGKRMEQDENLDYIMMGEGEITFAKFTDYMVAGEGTLSKIAGLCYRDGEQIVENPMAEPMNLSDVIFPYYQIPALENRIVYYETSRGCPFSCSYCLSSIDKRVRFRSLELVEKELDFFLEKRVPQVKFVDRTFNCNHDHAYAIWQYIYDRDNGVTNFHFEISADLLREEDYELFAKFRPGLIQLEIGVQSTNENTIKAICRQMNLDKVRSAVAKVHSQGNIHQHLDLIAGLPYEDYESFRTSFNEVYDMEPDQLQLGFLKVLTGSHMGEVKDDYDVLYQAEPPYEVLSTKWLPFSQVIRLKQVEEIVEVYYNSFQFQASMKFLLHYHTSAFDMFEALGDYYKQNHLFGLGHSRVARYEILWDYFQTLCQKDMDIFRDVLIFDLGLRENIKKQPSFMPDSDRDLLDLQKEFYQEEGKCYSYLPKSDYEGYNGKQLSKMTLLLRLSISMEKLLATGEVIKEEGLYLFDYKNRNPLNHSATVIHIPKR